MTRFSHALRGFVFCLIGEAGGGGPEAHRVTDARGGGRGGFSAYMALLLTAFSYLLDPVNRTLGQVMAESGDEGIEVNPSGLKVSLHT